MAAGPVGLPTWEAGVWADTVWEDGIWESITGDTMALPARAGVKTDWDITYLRAGVWQARAKLQAASEVTEPLTVPDFPIATIHIFGAFNSTNVSVLGYNADPNDTTATTGDIAVATPLALHQAHSPSSTFTAVAAEVLAGVIETPRYIIAQSNGAVTAVHVILIGFSQGNR